MGDRDITVAYHGNDHEQQCQQSTPHTMLMMAPTQPNPNARRETLCDDMMQDGYMLPGVEKW
jgi:hypothetical protein